MPPVFTVYNCGTGFNREHTEELIGHLGTITAGMQAKPGNVTPQCKWMICDGPGSSSSGTNPDAHTPGHGLLAKLRGNLTGYGWNNNVADAMGIIKFIHAGSPIAVINMAGWSRGAVTCHMLAHALYSDPATQNIAVNIFAADPVAGPGNRADPNKNTLPLNVANYFAVAAQDENRKIMKPVDVGQMLRTGVPIGQRIKYILVPGEHNTSVMKGTPLGKLVWFLAEKFLQKHGTQLNGTVNLTHIDICECYAGMRIYIEQFRQMHGSTGKQLGTKNRRLKDNFGNNVFWVNDHHRTQFMKAFPAIGPVVSNPWLAAQANGSPVLQAELTNMLHHAPWTYTALVKAGLINES